jgi:hypothetical protein
MDTEIIELPTEEFDIYKAKAFIKNLQVDKIKKYIFKYFYQTNTNIFLFYDVEQKKFIKYSKKALKSVYFNKLDIFLWKWFNSDGNIYNEITFINSPVVFKKKNQFYINF